MNYLGFMLNDIILWVSIYFVQCCASISSSTMNYCISSNLISFCAFLHPAASLNWSLMSLVDLLAFLFAQYAAPKNGKCRCYILFLNHISSFSHSAIVFPNTGFVTHIFLVFIILYFNLTMFGRMVVARCEGRKTCLICYIWFFLSHLFLTLKLH